MIVLAWLGASLVFTVIWCVVKRRRPESAPKEQPYQRWVPLAEQPSNRDEGDETDAIPEGLGVSAPRPIGTRTSPVAPVGKWTPAERELWIGVLEELERHQ